MAAKHQSNDQLVGTLSHLQNRPSISIAIIGLACSTATLCHQDIISDLPPVFDSIPELCNSSGPLIPNQDGPDLKTDVFCQVGAVLVKLCAPSWIYTLELTRIHPT